MSIPTKMALAGFIAGEPDFHFTAAGTPYCRTRVGIEQWRKEADGTFTQLEPSFHDMVSFETAARETYARFRPGDAFIASGYVHEYEHAGEIHEEFVARKIGHNAGKTNYAVIRPKVAAAPEAPVLGVEHPRPAIGL